jgi:glycosidase
MKRFLQFLFLSILSTPCFAQVQNATFSISPSSFNEDEQITITVSNVDPTIWNAGQPNNIYLWAWYFDLNGNLAGDSPTNGTWDASNEAQKLTNNGNGTYSFTLTPNTFFNVSGISKMGILVKAKDGTGDKKTQDFLTPVGKVLVTITKPTSNPVAVSSGGSLQVKASMKFQGVSAVGTFEVYLNNNLLTSGNGFPNYSTTLNNLTTGGTVKIVGTPQGETETGENSFELIIAPTVTTASLPANMVDGINYNSSDPTKATLVLDAPNKDFVYVAGSFNNYNPTTTYLMKKDPSSTKFWLELTGLTSGQIETYQYWVYALNPVANSPAEVKTADPFSTLVLSPFDDPYIPATSYPNLPPYPAGQQREVTVLQTGQTPYNWQVTNFNKPKKEDLVVYELLIRDFDADRNYQDLIDKIDYFKNLNINAIELMPVMEYEGNESWGYNTAFHMALDKFYGTENKLKEFIDLCHENGIAVILDVALNHAFGRNPMVRMWMDDPDRDGWGGPSSENPYFNQTAKHAYSVGDDFNHSQAITQNYVHRVIKHWIQDFKIDGLRWDLTKGFTQCCSASDETGTNAYQQDRVDILKGYADYSWSLDPSTYVIFEHLGQDNEEQQWANYKIDEGKGVMMWGKMTEPYNQLTMGFASNSNINRMGSDSHGFTGNRVMGYAESHDEERLMYKNLQYGNSTNSGHDVKNLNTALSRMSALGAISLTIPGPKMIWHFGELGMDNSIFTCNNGSVNNPDCKLDTKPQPQWVDNWLGNNNRNQIYNDWARLIKLKTGEPVFEGDYSINSGTLTPKIYIYDNSLPSTQLKNVVVLANFDVTSQNITPDFPYTGTWYDLMDDSGNTTLNVTSTTNPITIAAGQFKIYGNKAATLGIDDHVANANFSLYPNPASKTFQINKAVDGVAIYDATGKLIYSLKAHFEAKHEFDVSKIAQGLYIVKLDYNSSSVTKQLIIN